jgi:hypothetical protein
MKKPTIKGPVKMKCSLKQFVILLENLLVFHAMYKCSPPLFGPESSPSNANELHLAMCKLLAQTNSYCPHKEGNKWKLQKLHEVLHFPLMIFFFCHAENIDAGMDEHHLKDVLKDIACNSQQRGQDTFLSQCATRMHEKLIMTKAKHYSEAMEALCIELPTDIGSHDPPTSGNANGVRHTLPQGRMYIISHHNTTSVTDANGQVLGSCTVELKGMNRSTEIHCAILSWLGKNREIEIGNHCTTLDYYTEMKNVNKGTQYHAHPNYHNSGTWQDWAMVSFGTNSAGMPKKVPSRLLLFYKHQSTDDQGNVSDEIKAIVQTCNYRKVPQSIPPGGMTFDP